MKTKSKLILVFLSLALFCLAAPLFGGCTPTEITEGPPPQTDGGTTGETDPTIPTAEIGSLETEIAATLSSDRKFSLKLIPAYSGDYEFSVADPRAEFAVYESAALPDASRFLCRSRAEDGAAKGNANLSGNKSYFLLAEFPEDSAPSATFAARFLPTPVRKGERAQKTAEPGCTVVFEYDSTGTEAFDYRIESDGEVALEISCGVLNNGYYWQNGTALCGSVISEDRREFVKIKNADEAARSIALSLGEVEALDEKKPNSFEAPYTKIFSVLLPYTADVTLCLDSREPTSLEIYDDENKFVAGSAQNMSKNVDFTIVSNRKYYILTKQLSGSNRSASLRLEYDIPDLQFAWNSFCRIEKDRVFHYENRAISGDFFFLTDLAFKVYDARYEALGKNADGSYTLLKNKDYYFTFPEGGNDCHFDFDVVRDTAQSGTFPESGVVYIEFTPAESGEYRVGGADSYFWLNENFDFRYGNLNANRTYYLMLEGQAAEAYRIEISRVEAQRTQIPLSMGVERETGHYYFVVERQGEYSFRTFRNSDTIESDLSISDETGNIYCTRLCADRKTLTLTLSPGTYYLDLAVAPASETVAIRITGPKTMESLVSRIEKAD